MRILLSLVLTFLSNPMELIGWWKYSSMRIYCFTTVTKPSLAVHGTVCCQNTGTAIGVSPCIVVDQGRLTNLGKLKGRGEQDGGV